MAICADAVPPALDVGGGHKSACWLHARDLDAAQASPLARRPAGDPADPHGSAPAPGEEKEET
jgi:hypothetical protein